MTNAELKETATRLFRRLRRSFGLGMGEYLAVLEVIDWEDGPKTADALKLTLRLLWCHSLTEQSQLEDLWEGVVSLSAPARPAADPLPEPELPTAEPSETPDPPPAPAEPQAIATPLPQSEPELAAEALQPPLMIEADETGAALQTDFPVTRRSLTYLWRYLRRPVASGPADVFDLNATVQQVSQQGFFLAPVYARREVNQARLFLLIDQDGSMTPFHRFTRDLVETLWEDSSLQPENIGVYYFHNIPTGYVYTDSHCTQPLPLADVLASCDSETSVLVVSDAGAARGYRRMERLRLTTEFLVKLKQQTDLVGWLNPMRKERWAGTSAELIAYLVPMQPMTEDGVDKAIDVVRGQPLASGM